MAALRGGPVGRGLVIALAAAVFLAWSGAFGSDAAPLPGRLAYWVVMMVGGTAFGVAVGALVERRGWFAEQPWLQAALVTIVMTIPYSVVVWAVAAAVFPHTMAMSPVRHFGTVLVISAVMTAVNTLAGRRPTQTHAAAPGAPPARFLERLPSKLKGADIYAVEAQDHYLRLHTSKGTDLILMRLADAVAELEGLEGAQTHRSWWVAKAAVDHARRSDGRGVLTLRSGVEAPVSRRFARALRAEGWL